SRCGSTRSPARATSSRSRTSCGASRRRWQAASTPAARCGATDRRRAGEGPAAATLRRYSEAQARLEHAGGWAWRDRAASIVRGLGFADADLDRPLDTFSGGEVTRASLAGAPSSAPELLLLDEPTNHLDV